MKAEAAPRQERGRSGKMRFVILLFCLIFGGILAGYLLGERRGRLNGPPPMHSQSIQKRVVLNFDPFLIPIEAGTRYSLISLSFSLELPNGEGEETVERRMNEIRGFIYDILREDFTEAEGIPSMQAVKEGVSRAVRVVLPGLQVKDVYISRFLAL